MRALSATRQGSNDELQLIRAQHEPRARFFAGRLGWDVRVIDGIEADQLDCLDPTYILTLLDTGELAGCARLLPASGPTMARDVFAELLPQTGLPAHQGMVESSRFCVDKALGGSLSGSTVNGSRLTMFTAMRE